jgi:hypothetical protein
MNNYDNDNKYYQDNTEIYIEESKKKIDKYLKNNDFEGAFSMLITVLGRLDAEDIHYIVKNYEQYLFRNCKNKNNIIFTKTPLEKTSNK